jgi:high-affinity Fe2+/Pb2+ permease
MSKTNFSFRSWLFAVPVRAAIGTMLIILALGTMSRVLLHTETFLRNPMREIAIGLMVSLLAATLVYRHAKKLQQKR